MCRLKCLQKERCKFSPKTYIYIFFDSEWEYDSGESDLELTSHPLCGHRKGIRFLFFYKWLYFNFISTKVSRCCFIEQHFIIFRKFPSSKSFLPCQNTKEAQEGIDEATIIVKSVGKVAFFTSSFPSFPRPWPSVDQNVNVCACNCSVISQHWTGGTGGI